jgi:tetratricopeptide (TPR) repeat protein
MGGDSLMRIPQSIFHLSIRTGSLIALLLLFGCSSKTDSSNYVRDTADAHYEKGTAYFGMMEYKLAEEEFKLALEINPEHAESYAALGYLYNNSDNLTGARDMYQKAISYNPMNVNALYDLSKLYFSCDASYLEENLPLAEQLLNDAIEIDPNLPLVYVALGDINYRKGRANWDQAIAMYKKALQIDENLAVAHYALAYCFYNRNDRIQARPHCEKAMALNYNPPSGRLVVDQNGEGKSVCELLAKVRAGMERTAPLQNRNERP